MQKWNPGGTALRGRRREVLDPAQELFAPVSEGRAEHSSSGQKDRVKIAGGKPQRGGIVQRIGWAALSVAAAVTKQLRAAHGEVRLRPV